MKRTEMRKEREALDGIAATRIFVAALARTSPSALRVVAATAGGRRHGPAAAPLPGRRRKLIGRSASTKPRRYAENMQIANIEVHVEPSSQAPWRSSGHCIFQYIDVPGIEGALLIGDLPAAWYEQTAFDHYEQFPTDLYLQDRDAIWTDEDEDGRFDGHSDLHLDIYTARLHGTTEELVNYFARAYSYGGMVHWSTCPRLSSSMTTGPALARRRHFISKSCTRTWTC